MNNPFDSLETRLSRIEAQQQETLQYLKTLTQPMPQVGGMEVAEQVTGLSKARIYALVSAGEIPNAKRGNRLFFNRAELLNWIAEGRRGATA